MNRLRFCLNGQWVEDTQVAPTTTVLRYLRDQRGLTGTKEGCAEGDCGACTVAVVENGPDGKPTYRAVNSCLLLLPMVQGKHVVTVEGLKPTASAAPHPCQSAMASALGSQCGYCTPGIVMSLFEATYRSDMQETWKMDDQLCGNLCRCTGYRPIRAAAQTVAGTCPPDAFSTALEASAPESMALAYETKTQRFFTPSTMDELFKVLHHHANARVVVGGTDLSLEVTKRFEKPPCLVSLEGIASLKTLSESADGFSLGATATLSELEAFAESRLPAVARMARYFGARQIKHRATVGGNLCNASPIGDLAPVLISLGVTAVLASSKGERRIPLELFFTSYRKTALEAGEVLARVEVPRPSASAKSMAYKVSKRRELDISAVACGLYLQLNEAGVVTLARFAFGGMAATPKRATAVEQALLGQLWNEQTVETALQSLPSDFQPMNDHRGSAAYRMSVAENLVRGFFHETRGSHSPPLLPQHTATVQPPAAGEA
ncbi:MAG: xanthine dehydrogenase small subunit [Myxococcaceae bacterium]|nr:xanthine dehydrogenase small subunit [Myxococcaceae bacterium]